eukprot:6202726-Pleurochrysis_carterae.AAC.3
MFKEVLSQGMAAQDSVRRPWQLSGKGKNFIRREQLYRSAFKNVAITMSAQSIFRIHVDSLACNISVNQ